MNFPSIYDPKKVGKRYAPDINRAIAEGLAAGIPKANQTAASRLLLMVDPQIDFVMKDGALSVKGAIDDIRRTIEYMYRNAEHITGLMISLDQHIPFQIFYPTWWRDKHGDPVKPYTQITVDTLDKEYFPVIDPQWSRNYVHTLAKTKQSPLMIWPFHCMTGTDGAAVVPALAEAIAFLSAARGIQPIYVFKGTVPKTEHYGPFHPCVEVKNHPQGGLNTAVLDSLRRYKTIDVVGEAEDFCVREGMRQLLSYFANQPDVIKRMRFLKDCTSLVFPDNRKAANAILKGMAQKGVRIVTSTDPINA